MGIIWVPNDFGIKPCFVRAGAKRAQARQKQLYDDKGNNKEGYGCSHILAKYSLDMRQLTGTDCHSRIGSFSNTIPYFKVRNLIFRRIPLSFETEGKNNQIRGTRMFKLSLKWLVLYLYCNVRSLGWGPCWVRRCYRESLCWKMALNWVITGQIIWAAQNHIKNIT